MGEKEESREAFQEYLAEACYYLRKKGLSFQEISKALELPEGEVGLLCADYESKVAAGLEQENEVDRALWEDVYNDSLGNEKVTFARDDGFYHCRRFDLEKMDSPTLMAIFESSRRFLDLDTYKAYLDSKPPAGYDPIALQRQVKRAVELIETTLKERWVKEKAGPTETE